MSYLKRQELILVLSTLIVTSCTTGLDAGSIEKTFTGIKSTKVTGPESVQVNWDTNSGCEGYGVYRLGSDSDSNKIADATVPPYTVKTPFVESERSYTFAVGCNKGGKVQGLSVMQNAVTWPKFNGTLVSSIDASGQKPVVVLKWNYTASTEVVFDLYVKPSPLPTSISTWTLNRVGGVGSAYSDTKMCSVMGNQVRLGEGSCPALEGGQGYMFKVVAHYPDSTYSTDLAGVGAYIDVPPPFTAPDCILTSAGIGADAATSSLFLRCSDQALTISCPAGTISTHAYQGVNGTRISVSDTLTGSGTLRIQPQLSTGQLNDRSVENLEIEYTCAGPGITQKSAVRYDGNPVVRPDGTSYIPNKPVLKFNSADFVRAPNESKSEIPSYYGKALAVGDFNCNGKPDLAVGLPDVTYNQAPYFSKNPGSGAVIVYYDYVQNADGSISATDTQYLSFSDLPSYARFGSSLSAGNINRDYVLRPDGNTYACDDLIIGAPGDINSNNLYLGEAYIFYGHPQKFSQPLNLSTLTVNDSTCHGSIDATVCDPVRLYQDMQSDYKIAVADNVTGAKSGVPKNTFGFSVSYIRDFNADGYGDIAIGDPYCHWDGEVRNGFGDEPGGGNRIYNVGCVYVYWGGPNGIQRVDVGPEPGTANRIIAPFVKIFPPIPQPAMHFGWSIGGGGDVDGRLPVPLVNNAGNVILAEGNDFVVGAPDFNYANGTTAFGSINNSMAWTVIDGGGAEHRDPLVTINESQAYEFNGDPNASTKITPPLNGAWTTPGAWTGSPMPIPANPVLRASTGIAFLYLGRSSMAEFSLAPKSGSYYRLPKAVTDPEDPLTNTPGAPTILNLISANTQSRQNGSKGFTLGSVLTGIQPVDSFYNCGTRGASGAPKVSGADAGRHKHISCFAGRSNVSWIFPQVTSSDTPVLGFGSNVTIAGSKEQNPVALLEIGNARIQSTAANTYQRQLADGSKFVGYAQGNIHERIIGDSLWELGYRKGTMEDGQNPLPCEEVSGAVGDMTTAAYDSAAQTCQNVRPTRAAIRESYANIRGLSSIPDGNIQADVNRDGYADVLVSSRTGEFYTFFGNYAADFAFAYNLANTGGSGVTVPYSTTSNCNLTNYANVSSITDDLVPYSTYTWSHALSTGSVNYTWSSIHPVRPKAPGGGYSLRLGFIGDSSLSQSSSYGGYSYTSNANILNALKNCMPQRKKYLTAANSIAAADLNDDHIVDGVLGYPAETSSTGMARAFIANSSGGGGLASEFVYNSGASNWGKAGYAVTATNWRFLKSAPDSYEMTRRDLFMGAPYSVRGNGAVIGYSGYNGAQIAGGTPTTLTFTVPVPSALNADNSKIIGDVNGDGFDDIFVPVKRLDARGNIYYDAIIYFGSSFGPVTTPMCLDKQASITKSNGSVISSSDCNASISGQTALMGTTPIRLPQYYSRPSGMSWSWAVRIQPAGDINGDGRSDIYVIDIEAAKSSGSDQGVVYALFGSDIGLSNGSPAMGPSTNKTPQIVTQNDWIISMAGSRSPATASSNFLLGMGIGNSNPTGTGFAYAHGDFNGDGYEDVAWGLPYAYSFQTSNKWLCNPAIGSLTQMSFCGFKDTIGGVTYNVDAPAPGRFIPATGAVVVMYGGPQGVQTPINGLGAAVDFDYNPYVTCDDFYHNCKKADPNNVVQYTDSRGASNSYYNASPVNTTLYNYARIVYGSITRSGNGFTINTTASDTDPDKRKPSCVPGTGSRAPDICLATLIPTPVFYNVDNSYASLQELFFGSVMTAADINGDGIDDLIVGQSRFYHTGGLSTLNTTAAAPAEGKIVNAPTVADAGTHGAAFIYYGARGYGLVAPNAERYLGPQARGVDATGAVQSNALVFQIYPSYDATHKPPLDTQEYARNFASNLSAGDFNGDGNDDLAIASGRGHVYVYYGPICQWDNSTSALADPNYSMYYKPNVTIDTASAIPASSCQTIMFNNSSELNPLFTAVPSKRLAPQMISIAGLAGTEWMGTTLISMRKGKGNIKNSNVASENQKASDLIIAGSAANDPNASTVNYKYTGLGYAFFGHTTGDSSFKTKGGLFVSNASYNSSITKIDVVESSVNVSYFYYSPIILRPHTTNSSVARFFVDTTTAGDVNGDGRMDLLMPTSDLDTTQDGTGASYGGGFRLFY